MGRVSYEHFCLLIFGQGKWKENFEKKVSKETKSSFFHLSGYTTDSLFCTCPICNALVKLFDPSNPGDYVEICDYCKGLYKVFRIIQGTNEGMILFSHNLFKEATQIENLTQNLLSNEKIKKLYILQVDWEKISKPYSELSREITQQRINKSEFLSMLREIGLEYKIIYEIYKDKYF